VEAFLKRLLFGEIAYCNITIVYRIGSLSRRNTCWLERCIIPPMYVYSYTTWSEHAYLLAIRNMEGQSSTKTTLRRKWSLPALKMFLLPVSSTVQEYTVLIIMHFGIASENKSLWILLHDDRPFYYAPGPDPWLTVRRLRSRKGNEFCLGRGHSSSLLTVDVPTGSRQWPTTKTTSFDWLLSSINGIMVYTNVEKLSDNHWPTLWTWMCWRRSSAIIVYV
jgi:hypothetical protein